MYTIFTRLFLYTKTKSAASDHSETAVSLSKINNNLPYNVI
nr:MAG TPA: hypothetical protein [Caudoviricetes sp.]